MNTESVKKLGNCVNIVIVSDTDTAKDLKFELPNFFNVDVIKYSDFKTETCKFYDVIITIGNMDQAMTLAPMISTRTKKHSWSHIKELSTITADFIEGCYRNQLLIEYPSPLISVVTTAFKSGDRIKRPWNSLKNQNYRNWEWIVIDDNMNEDAENFKKELFELTEGDARVKYVRVGFEHSGYIGEVKRHGFMLAMGDWILEFDHDDELSPILFDQINKLVTTEPKMKTEYGFIYTDTIELFEESLDSFCYGETFAYGTGSTHNIICVDQKSTKQCVSVSPPINPTSLSHIVGSPNHARIWRRDVYLKTGGHNPRLAVGDDYDLILRTFLETKFVKLAGVQAYFQFRNSKGNNFTFIRNALIQYNVKHTYPIYEERIKERFEELSKDTTIPKTPYVGERYEYYWDPYDQDVVNPCISIVMPTFNRPDHLRRAINSVFNQTYQNFVLYIVGDKCPQLDSFMKVFFEKERDKDFYRKIKWWNLTKNYGAGGAIPRNYALERLITSKWVAYLDDDNLWEPEHLHTIVDTINKNPEATMIFTNFVVDGKTIECRDPPVKGSVDTSSICHRRDLIFKYPMWQTRQVDGYAHDWAFFSRMLNGGEKYALTKKATMLYNTEFNGQTFGSISSLISAQPSSSISA